MTTARRFQFTPIAWLSGAELPSDWSRSKVKYLAPGMRAGENITAEEIEETGSYPVYGGNGLRGFTEASTHRGTRILIGRQGALCGNIHLVSGEFWASEHAIVAAPIPSVDARWLAYTLWVMDLGQYSQTAAQPGIGTTQIDALQVPLPHVNEQHAIADYLDRETAQIDTLIDEQQALIELLRERRRATIAGTLSSISSHRTRLKHIAHIQSGMTLSGDGDSGDPEWPYLRVANVQVGYIDTAEVKSVRVAERHARQFLLQPGDVLMTEGGDIDKLGRGALWYGEIEPMLHQNHIFSVRPRSELTPAYLVYWLESGEARSYFRMTAKKTTNLAATNKWTLGNLPISVPPLEDQRRIATHLDEETTKIDTLIAETERFIELARERREALITAAVTGQIDVRPPTGTLQA